MNDRLSGIILPQVDREHAFQPSHLNVRCALCSNRAGAWPHKPSNQDIERAAPYAYNPTTHTLRRLVRISR